MYKCIRRAEASDKRTIADRMDTSASSSQIAILFHQVNQQLHRVRLEIDITIQRQQIRVLRHHFLPFDRNRQFHQPMAKQVVHVHNLYMAAVIHYSLNRVSRRRRPTYLTPAFSVTNFRFVLQVHEHFRLPRQRPHHSASVGCRNLGGWFYANVRLMHVRCSFIYGCH